MTRLLYTLMLYVVLPLFVLRQAWRGRQRPDARAALAARFGFVPRLSERPLWLHCVSVGEAVAAEPLVAALHALQVPMLVTSTTFTGADRVRSRLSASVRQCYMPYDTQGAVRRFLDRVQPRQLVILETELWPNLLHACRQRGIPVLLVNARLSARSARGYARFAALAKPMLQNLTWIAAQGDADAQRFIALGMPAARVQVTGNLKFDIDTDTAAQTDAQALRLRIGPRPVWIAASTHDGEDGIVLAAHRQLQAAFPAALLILVPRHPERFAAVAALVAQHGFACAQRARDDAPGAPVAVYLGNTMGELPLFYAASDVAFVGGSLMPVGGHNFLEPAALALPLLAGPHCFNFQVIGDELVAAGALGIVHDAAELAAGIAQLFADAGKRSAAGAAAREYVERNRGACQRTLALVLETSAPAVQKR